MKNTTVGVDLAKNVIQVCVYTSKKGSFKGKDASACIGLTSIQYSSGGKIKQGSIGKYVKNSLLRS